MTAVTHIAKSRPLAKGTPTYVNRLLGVWRLARTAVNGPISMKNAIA
jgi:hypothetical protein